jgi:hypothetical protein
VVSIPVCHAGDPGSIPGREAFPSNPARYTRTTRKGHFYSGSPYDSLEERLTTDQWVAGWNPLTDGFSATAALLLASGPPLVPKRAARKWLLSSMAERRPSKTEVTGSIPVAAFAFRPSALPGGGRRCKDRPGHVGAVELTPRRAQPSVAQLVEHVTVDLAAITGSLVRFRPEGILFCAPPPPRGAGCRKSGGAAGRGCPDGRKAEGEEKQREKEWRQEAETGNKAAEGSLLRGRVGFTTTTRITTVESAVLSCYWFLCVLLQETALQEQKKRREVYS